MISSIISSISSIFTSTTTLIDDFNLTEEEKITLSSKLAEIESKVSVKLIEMQSQSIEATSKLETVIQANGNFLTRSVRPLISLCSFLMIASMGLNIIPTNELILQICGGYLGIYAGLRTYEKKKGE